MASDLGQSIFAQQNGGRTQPYGYDATNDSSITISKYTQSILDAYGKEFLPVTMDYRSPLVAFGGLTNYGNQAALDITFWKNNSTPKAYHDYAVDYEAKRYDQIKMYISSSVRS